MFVVGCGCCGCCWFGLPWTTLRQTTRRRTKLRRDPSFRRTAQNFALFFPLSHPHFCSFCVSLGVFSLNFGGVFEKRNLTCARLGRSGLSFDNPRTAFGPQPLRAQSLRSRPHPSTGSPHPSRDAPRAKWSGVPGPHPSGPHPSTAQPFGAPPFGGPTLFGASPFGGPTLRGPHFFWIGGNQPSGNNRSGAPLLSGPYPTLLPSKGVFEQEGRKSETPILAKVGLAEVGHPNFGQSRSIKVGQSRSNFWASVGYGQSRIGQSRSRMAKVGLAEVGISRFKA